MANFFKTISNTIKYWFIPFIIGILFIIAGIYTFITPEESYVALSFLFSVLFIISGIAEIIFAFSNRKAMDNWAWILFFGILSAAIGTLLFLNPKISMATMPFYIGFLILFRSIAGVSFALDLKSYGILDWGNFMVLSVLGIIFSFILLWNPYFAGMAIVFWTGLVFIIAGAFIIYFGLLLRRIKRTPQRISKNLKNRLDEFTNEIASAFKPKK